MADGDRERAVMWGSAVIAAFLALGIAVAAFAVAVFASDDGDGSGDATGASASGDAAASGGLPSLSLSEFAITGDLEVPVGDTTLSVTNDGEVPHNVALRDGPSTPDLASGESATLALGDLAAGTYELWCTIPGHAEAGMTADLVVGGDGAVAAGDGGGSTADSADAFATRLDFGAEWDDAFVARDPSAPVTPDATVHEIELVATEVELEVAPGLTQVMWTFNDQVPGPTLRGKVGDIFRITLTNDGEFPHSVDFHASKVAWNDEMRSIEPGESLVYEFEAQHAGIWMYHCGTAPTLHHIGMGMYGAVIVDPPDLAAVDHEFVFVQSEIYEAPEGEVASLQKMMDDDWDAVVFNGAVNQYRDRPIEVGVGERVRAWVLDDGPSENSSFHIVGTIFDTVFKEGSYRLRPNDGQLGGSQALDLQPAQGGFVEFTLDEEGLYPMVTHKFSNVTKGALGLFQAGDGEPDDPTPILTSG